MLRTNNKGISGRCNVRIMIFLTLTLVSLVSLLLSISTKLKQGRLHSSLKRLKEIFSPVEELTKDNFVGRELEDPSLVAYIRDYEIYQPSRVPYNLTNPERKDFSQYGQSTYAEENFLKGMTGGFFLEAGALDGEDKSNSLYFEKYRGWTGLLVEPNIALFQHLSSLNRKAYSINAGFSFTNISGTATFVPHRGLSKIRKGARNGYTIRTFPLYSMLLAIGVFQIDFFTLDIEGNEKKVLDTIPWDNVKFRLICMEIDKFTGGPSAYIGYLEKRGYTYLGNKDIDAWFGYKPLLQETMDVDDWLRKNEHKLGKQRGGLIPQLPKI